MTSINWHFIKGSELKDINYLVNAFGRYLKKECEYTPEQAKFAKDVIDDPYGYKHVEKQYQTTAEIDGIKYEIYLCRINDCDVEKYFTFYMLIDVSTINEDYDKQRAYIFAKKKYILVK